MSDRPHSGRFMTGLVFLPAAAFLLPLALVFISPDVGRPLVFDLFDRIGWPLIIGLYTLATVALLLAGLLRYRKHPRLLAACLTLSLLLHLLLIAVFGLWVIQHRAPAGGEEERHYAVGFGLPSQAESRLAEQLHDRLREEARADARRLEAERAASGDPSTPSAARPAQTPAVTSSSQTPARLDPRTAAAEASARRAQEELAQAERAAAEVRRDQLVRAQTLESQKAAAEAERATERAALDPARAASAPSADAARAHERADVKEVDRRPDRAATTETPEAVARAQRVREALEQTSLEQQVSDIGRKAEPLADRKADAAEAAKQTRERELELARRETGAPAESPAAVARAPEARGRTSEAERRRMERELPEMAEKAPEAPAESSAPTLMARLADAAKNLNPFGKVEGVERTADTAAPAGPRTETEREAMAAERAAGRLAGGEGAEARPAAPLAGGNEQEAARTLAAGNDALAGRAAPRGVSVEEAMAGAAGAGARADANPTVALGGRMPSVASGVGREEQGPRAGGDRRAVLAAGRAGGAAEASDGGEVAPLLRAGGWSEALTEAAGGEATLVQTAPGAGGGTRRALPAVEDTAADAGGGGVAMPVIALPTRSAPTLAAGGRGDAVPAARDLQARGNIGQVRSARGTSAEAGGVDVGLVRWEGGAAEAGPEGATRLLTAAPRGIAPSGGGAARGVSEALTGAETRNVSARPVAVGGQARGLARSSESGAEDGGRELADVGNLLLPRAAGSADTGAAVAAGEPASGRALTQLASASTAGSGARLADDAPLPAAGGGARAEVTESLQQGGGRAPAWLAQTLVDLGGAKPVAVASGGGASEAVQPAGSKGDRRAFDVARSGAAGAVAAATDARVAPGGVPREGVLDRAADGRAPMRVEIASVTGGAPTGFELPERLSEPEPSVRKGVSLRTVGRAPVPTSLSQKSIYVMRQPETRQKHIAELGGTPETEQAVERALVWLAQAQSDDGRWDVDNFKTAGACGGAGDRIDGDVALSGLTLLTYLGAGYTHLDGPHQDTVRRGLEWILAGQKPDGDLRRGGQLYGQAMATAALSECYSMTGDARLREPLEQAVKFILESQNPNAGWRYMPGEDNDTSVVGWMILALKSAEIAGIKVPAKHYDWAGQWLERVRKGERGGLFAYKEGHGATPVMTAEGWFCEMFLAQKSTSRGQDEAVAFLMESPPVWTAKREPGGPLIHMYYWYYATLSLYISGEPEFGRWNAMLTEALLKGQRQDGAAKGSWDPLCLLGDRGGRVYATAMGTLCLEVYYRYLPFYKAQGKKLD